jgi:CheY-like chemotaxis protein
MSRVLIVDNAALFRMLDASFLRRAGWDVAAARTPDDFVARARDFRADLVLLDTDAGFDAASCVRRLKAEDDLRAIPILALAPAAEAADCEAAGAEAILTTPVAPAAVEAALCALARIMPRARRRRPTRLHARVFTPAGPVRGRLRDISVSGVFLWLPCGAPAGTALDLHLRLPLPEGPRAVEAGGIVVREVGENPASPQVAGVGVRFTRVRGEGSTVIDRFVRLEVDATEDDDAPGESATS